MLTEQEVVGAALGQHSLQAAEKYVQEVLWRTYWKGWLEMRPSVWTQYQQERGLQQQAQLGQAALAQAAPSIYGQQFLPSQALGQVGMQQEAIAGLPLQEQMARFQFGQQLPYQQLQGYLSSVYGSPMGSYGTQTTQQPLYQNRTTGALGGALAGGLGGYALGQAFPSLAGTLGSSYAAPAIGAIGGGLLGGFL
jgi:hypothetical protein